VTFRKAEFTINNLAVRQNSNALGSFRFPAHPIAGLAGTSLKHEHLAAILAEAKQARFLGAGGLPHDALTKIRRDYPISLHGVCNGKDVPPTSPGCSRRAPLSQFIWETHDKWLLKGEWRAAAERDESAASLNG
jgi:hypothetical protein